MWWWNDSKAREEAMKAIANVQECTYKVGNESSSTMDLPDGRKLGYAQYGLRTGQPIFYSHGLPGSRIEAAFLDKEATRLGARIIAIDRPGVGWSSPLPGRKLLDYPKDVERLADHLGIKEFAMMVVTHDLLVYEVSYTDNWPLGNIRRRSIHACMRICSST